MMQRICYVLLLMTRPIVIQRTGSRLRTTNQHRSEGPRYPCAARLPPRDQHATKPAVVPPQKDGRQPTCSNLATVILTLLTQQHVE